MYCKTDVFYNKQLLSESYSSFQSINRNNQRKKYSEGEMLQSATKWCCVKTLTAVFYFAQKN